MTRVRIGIAVLLPPEVASEVDGVRRAVGSAQLHRIEPHITLHPPSNCDCADLSALIYNLRQSASEFGEFRIEINGSGEFASDPSVLFLAVEESQDLTLIEHAIRSAISGRPRQRNFVPHITLYDNADPEFAARARSVLSSFRYSFVIESFWILFQDKKGSWQRYAEISLSEARNRAAGGLPMKYFRCGEPGPWVEAERSGTYSGYPSSNAEIGISPQKRVSLVGYRDRSLVTFGSAAVSGSAAWLEWLWVSPEERGFGIASVTSDELALYCAEQGCTTMSLAKTTSSEKSFDAIAKTMMGKGAIEVTSYDPIAQKSKSAYSLSLVSLW